jgi:hypothetical protein
MHNHWFEAFRLGPAEVALGRHFLFAGRTATKLLWDFVADDLEAE